MFDIVQNEHVINWFDGTEYDFLSNFHPCEVTYNGLTFGTTEAAFQAAKCDHPMMRLTFVGLTPAAAKSRGQRVQLRSDWEQIKETVMLELLMQKFGYYTNHTPEQIALRDKLLDTGYALLIEGNSWRDNYWGVADPAIGKNRLGLLLMLVRSQLIEPFSKASVCQTCLGRERVRKIGSMTEEVPCECVL